MLMLLVPYAKSKTARWMRLDGRWNVLDQPHALVEATGISIGTIPAEMIPDLAGKVTTFKLAFEGAMSLIAIIRAAV